MFDFAFSTVDRSLAVLGLLISIFSIWIARHYYKKSLVTKLLAVAVTEPIRLSTSSNISVVLDGKEYKYLEKRYYLLLNKGSSPIEESDFLSDISILDDDIVSGSKDDSEKINVVKFSIAAKDGLVLVAPIKHGVGAYRVKLIRPGESIIFVVYYTKKNYLPFPDISTKSKESVRRDGLTEEIMPSIAAFLFSVGTFLMATSDGFGIFSISPEIADFGRSYLRISVYGVAGFLFGIGGPVVVGLGTFFLCRKYVRRGKSSTTVRFADAYLKALNLKNSAAWSYFDKSDII